MYQEFGALVADRKVEFKLFFPDNAIDPGQYRRGGSPKIREIRVRGDFQNLIGGADWDFDSAPRMSLEAHPKGWLYTCKIDEVLPGGFYQYKYFVTFENDTRRWCTDPCTKYGGKGDHENSAFVIGGNAASARPLAQRLSPQDLVVYELMLDDFTAEFRGQRPPIDAVLDKLDYLEDLGINAVEFMPWTAWPGTDFSWGYDPFQFFAVEFRYVHAEGNPSDKLFKLKTLINALHERQIHVIMDGVFNHVRAGTNPNGGFAYKWLYQDPEDSPYIGDFVPLAFDFFEDFDYGNGCVQEFIRDVCLYWLQKFAVDGFRFDFTLGFYNPQNPQAGITRLIEDLKNQLAQPGQEPPAFFVEHLTDNRYQAIDDTNRMCAHGSWFDPFMFQAQHYAHHGIVDGEILRILDANRDYTVGKGPVTYIENHDHSTIVNQAGGRERWFKTQPAALALLTSPGTVLIHNGQEFGEDYFLPESGAGRVSPRPLRWQEHSPESQDFAGKRLHAVYKQLIEIRNNHPSLRSPNFFPVVNHPDGYGVYPDKGVVIYHRFGPGQDGRLERFILVINFSDFDQFVDIPFSINGEWEELLSGGRVTIENFRLPDQKINSNWGRIYLITG